MDLGDLAKSILPVVIGSALGPGIGTAIAGTGASPFLSRALTGAAISKLSGGKSKDAIRDALLSGIGGMAFDSFSGQQVAQEGQALKPGEFSKAEIERNQLVPTGSETIGGSKPPVEQSAQNVQGVRPRTFSGELLKSAGIGDDNLLARLLNTRVGEGLTAGLIAQLLAGDDDDEQPREFEQRPFGFGGPGGQLGGIRFAADGGPMSFPRRTGGIDPSEGSGRKDDVPAMLMAGEFVLTKDAVKGLGDGNSRKGIQRAYNMMDQLEARA
jgi:hypothetical protein